MFRYWTVLPILCLSLAALPVPAGTVPEFLASAIADPARPPADTERDADRKPAQTLLYAGIAPGQQIAELFRAAAISPAS